MGYVIVGLGNPGNEYENTRHNAGRMAVEHFGKKNGIDEWRVDKKAVATVAKADDATLVLPDTYMNKSGSAVARYVKSVKAAEKLIVVYDDLDLPIGKVKLSFDRGSGGHKGIESITRAVKTKKFVRVRVGVSPHTPSGKIRKPSGEDEVVKFILAKFKPAEIDVLKKLWKTTDEALACIMAEGREVAMNRFNSL
jgi:PTH1 family peptidyl-tRNA hydrolase